ncbi:MAG: hypothetical protein HC849_29005 [Oscillatoriales cyanobacterium RU_3_3]|nr:hypothetical protein [Oscillatoriales cyanobacterium RU_3_3]
MRRFQNNPEDVARYFYHHLVENPQLKGFFERIAFAILDNSKNRAIIKPFQAIFDPS